jgi:hypothetical protein
MVDWLKRSNSTDALEERKHNGQLQKMLADQLKASAERETQLIDALDRVLVF